MAKISYKIPTSLDRSYMDQTIPLSWGGFTAQPVPMKTIVFYLGTIVFTFWMLTNTFVQDAPLWLKLLIVVWFIFAMVFFGQTSKTKELKIMQVIPLLQYIPRSSRKVITRSTNNASAFYSIVGIKSISKNGLIEFLDGRVGQAYLVVGSASILLFDEDRKAILNRVDAFWRKYDTDTELTFLTTKEPQRIYKQVANVERCNQALEIRDPELLDLLDERLEILTNYVGAEFKSIHQYMLLTADNKEQLRQGHNVIAAEADGSSYMLKSCTMLNGNDVLDMLSVIYRGR